ncbi:RNA polymerase factor sigma-54 [Fervidobacterium sp.]
MPDSKRTNSNQSLTPKLEQKLLLTKKEKIYLNILETPFYLLKAKYLPLTDVKDDYYAHNEDLHEVLIRLLPFFGLSDEEEEIVEYIIYNIDSKGRLRITPEELAEKYNLTLEHANKLINFILTEFSEEIAQNSQSDYEYYIEPDAILTPEKVEVRKIDVKDPVIAKAIQMREETLRKICEEIRKVNEYFLRGYRKYPQVLTMRYIARILGVHVSTISRAVRNKYVSTPIGVLPLRIFFGKTLDSKIILQELERILSVDNSIKDSYIALILKSSGIQISRRTVNKYRKMIGK